MIGPADHGEVTTASRSSAQGAGRRVPAWACSLALHATLLVAVGLIADSRVHGPAVAEPSRPVGIVLARRQLSAPTDYLMAASAAAPWNVDAPDPSAAVASAVDAAELERAVATDFQLPATASLGPAPGVNLAGSSSLRVTHRRPAAVGGNDAAVLAAEAERRAARAAMGSPATVRLFGGGDAVGRSFVFLIDRSKSMGSSGLDVLDDAAAELERAVRELQPHHRFQVAAYSDRCLFLRERGLLPATPENQAAIRGFVNGLLALGATGHANAIEVALALEPDVIYVLTDGGEPPLSPGDFQRIRRLARGRSAIHCVHFGFGTPQDEHHFLQRLASENGGEYGYVDVARPAVGP